VTGGKGRSPTYTPLFTGRCGRYVVVVVLPYVLSSFTPRRFWFVHHNAATSGRAEVDITPLHSPIPDHKVNQPCPPSLNSGEAAGWCDDDGRRGVGKSPRRMVRLTEAGHQVGGATTLTSSTPSPSDQISHIRPTRRSCDQPDSSSLPVHWLGYG
jgi:hypothetical protein